MNQTITLDSSEDESNQSVMIIDSDNETNNSNCLLKRELSVQSIVEISVLPKKKKIMQSLDEVKGEEKKKIILSLKEFTQNDPRHDKRLYYNRIDDTDIDYDLLAWAQLEVILDHVSMGFICFTVEHYYHQMLKKKRVQIIQRHYDTLINENRIMFMNKVPIFSEEFFKEAKKEFEHQFERTAEAGKASLNELRSFARFISNLYGDKAIKLF